MGERRTVLVAVRISPAEVERERTRQVSRIGNNLNQAVEIVARLVAIERALQALAPVESPEADAR